MNTKTSEALNSAETAVEEAKQKLSKAEEANKTKPNNTTKAAVNASKAELEAAEASLDAIKQAVQSTPEQQEPLLESEKQTLAVEQVRAESQAKEVAQAEALANKPVVKRIEPLRQQDFGAAVHKYSIYDAKVPHGTPVSNLTDESFWVNIGRQLSIGDEIRVVPDDCAYYATLLVIGANGNRVKTEVVNFKEFQAVPSREVGSGPYSIEVRGRLKYCVIERATGKIMQTNIDSLQEANHYATDLQKALSM